MSCLPTSGAVVGAAILREAQDHVGAQRAVRGLLAGIMLEQPANAIALILRLASSQQTKYEPLFERLRIFNLIDRDLCVEPQPSVLVILDPSTCLSLKPGILANRIETDFYIIGDAQALRRSSSQSPVFYESYASIFVISSRTGRLLFGITPSFQADSSNAAEEKLISHLVTGEMIQRCMNAIRQALKDEQNERVVAVEANAPIIRRSS